MALCPNVFRASGETATQRPPPRLEQRLDLSVPLHPLGKTHPTGALARAEHRPHQGKNAGGLREQPGRVVGQMLPVQFGQSLLEIIAHQRDRQVGGALDDANAQSSQRVAEFTCPLHIDRLNAHATFLKIFLRGLRQQAEARPIGGRRAGGRTRRADDVAAVDQPLQGFLDFVGRKIPLQLANELAKTLSAFRYRGRERTIELAVKKELPVLGIEAHDVGGQHIDGEIRRELRDVFARTLRKAGRAIACHEVNIHTLPQLRTVSARRILRLREFRRPARALVFLDLAFLDRLATRSAECARLARIQVGRAANKTPLAGLNCQTRP